MTYGKHGLPFRTVMCSVLALVLIPAIGVTGGSRLESADPSRADEHALWLGHRVLAIAAAIRNPHAPEAMEAVLELGLDSRHYVMVRGWLVMQLRGDKVIVQARDGDVSPQIVARIAFLEEAIRAIDLE